MVVIDTHVWLWWLHDPSQLSRRARSLLAKHTAADGDGALLSVISVWEVALKVTVGKLHLHMDLDSWYARARAYPGIDIVELSADDAIESTRLPGDFHRDPADQMIVALARRLGSRLITRDRRILAYEHVNAVW